MGFELDKSTAYGAKVADQVVERKLGWLTTVGADGTPQPNPVWFKTQCSNLRITVDQ